MWKGALTSARRRLRPDRKLRPPETRQAQNTVTVTPSSFKPERLNRGILCPTSAGGASSAGASSAAAAFPLLLAAGSWEYYSIQARRPHLARQKG